MRGQYRHSAESKPAHPHATCPCDRRCTHRLRRVLRGHDAVAATGSWRASPLDPVQIALYIATSATLKSQTVFSRRRESAPGPARNTKRPAHSFMVNSHRNSLVRVPLHSLCSNDIHLRFRSAGRLHENKPAFDIWSGIHPRMVISSTGHVIFVLYSR